MGGVGELYVHYLLLLGHGEEDEGKLDDVGNDLGLQVHARKLCKFSLMRARKRSKLVHVL